MFTFGWNQNLKLMALTETQWQQLVDYKQARIEALEKENKWLKEVRDVLSKDADILIKAHNETLDFINSKLNSNG